jgi:thioredoxin-related protein
MLRCLSDFRNIFCFILLSLPALFACSNPKCGQWRKEEVKFPVVDSVSRNKIMRFTACGWDSADLKVLCDPFLRMTGFNNFNGPVVTCGELLDSFRVFTQSKDYPRIQKTIIRLDSARKSLNYRMKNIQYHSPFEGKTPAQIDSMKRLMPPPPVRATIGGQADYSFLCGTPKYGSIFKAPANLPVYFEYKQALECARKLHKPLLIYFTGWTCANCVKMERNCFPNPEVYNLLSKEFVIVSLYVDDRFQVPQAEWVKDKSSGSILKTIGDINEAFEEGHYQANYQPLFVIIDPGQKKTLSKLSGYQYNEDFLAFLKKGLEAFKTK